MKKIIVLLMSAFVMTAHADRLGAGALELSPYAGYTLLDSFGGNNPKNSLIYGFRLGLFMTDHVSFEPSYQLNLTKTDRTAGAQSDVTFHTVRFNLLYNFLPESRISPFITGGLGWLRTDIKNTLKANDLATNAGLGTRVFITEQLAVRLDARYIYSEVESERQHNFEGTGGLSYVFGGQAPKDTDSDGVKDRKDACPDTPSGATVDLKGCPRDSDTDGIFDGIDQCADTQKGIKVDPKGCPLDGDQDKVPDGLDMCPDSVAGAMVDEKGCSKDKDMDGVEDAIDECPNTPKGTPVNEKGCTKDSDGDGVSDLIDQCANTPVGTKIDERGCPVVTKSRGVLSGVHFESGSATLTPDSYVILDTVAKELSEFEKVNVEVQGHTDNVGLAATNIKISNARAQSVVDYLVSKGIARERLTAKGFGPSVPLAENKTKAGRAKNRRVELKWLD